MSGGGERSPRPLGPAEGVPPPAEALRVEEAARALAERLPLRPEVLVVLGSGLGGMAGAVTGGVQVPFQDVPGFPTPGVEGHAGRFVAGELEGCAVLLQAGRFHLYEGHPPETVVRPVRVAAALGVGTLVVTNAAGALDRGLRPGTLLLLDDMINFQFRSALAGPVLPGEPRFPDLSTPFDPELRELARRVAREQGIHLARGTYVGMLGPSYETPAEVRMLASLGGDAVGMSTVLEVTAARARGMRVLGFSVITNPGAGLEPAPLDHAEVLEVGREAGLRLERLLRGVLRALPPREPGTGGG